MIMANGGARRAENIQRCRGTEQRAQEILYLPVTQCLNRVLSNSKALLYLRTLGLTDDASFPTLNAHPPRKAAAPSPAEPLRPAQSLPTNLRFPQAGSPAGPDHQDPKPAGPDHQDPSGISMDRNPSTEIQSPNLRHDHQSVKSALLTLVTPGRGPSGHYKPQPPPSFSSPQFPTQRK